MRLLLKHPAHDGTRLHPVGFCPNWPNDVKPPSTAKEVAPDYVPPEEKAVANEPDTLSAHRTMTLDEARKIIEAEWEEQREKKEAEEKEKEDKAKSKTSQKSTSNKTSSGLDL